MRKAIGVRGMLYPDLGKNSPIPTNTKMNLYTMYIKSTLTYVGAAWELIYPKQTGLRSRPFKIFPYHNSNGTLLCYKPNSKNYS